MEGESNKGSGVITDSPTKNRPIIEYLKDLRFPKPKESFENGWNEALDMAIKKLESQRGIKDGE